LLQFSSCFAAQSDGLSHTANEKKIPHAVAITPFRYADKNMWKVYLGVKPPGFTTWRLHEIHKEKGNKNT
jgi:hypothetical protein